MKLGRNNAGYLLLLTLIWHHLWRSVLYYMNFFCGSKFLSFLDFWKSIDLFEKKIKIPTQHQISRGAKPECAPGAPQIFLNLLYKMGCVAPPILKAVWRHYRFGIGAQKIQPITYTSLIDF